MQLPQIGDNVLNPVQSVKFDESPSVTNRFAVKSFQGGAIYRAAVSERVSGVAFNILVPVTATGPVLLVSS